MKIEIVTMFPGFFTSPLATSMVHRACRRGAVGFDIHDLRDFADQPHNSLDDTPYGGGGGMVMKLEPIARAWEELDLGTGHTIYLTADGEPLTQDLAVELSLMNHLVLLCGHYKGVDERVRQTCVDREVSVGDYVLTGGEPAALVLVDAIIRLIPGVLGNFTSALGDSFQDDLLDCPWYTKPEKFAGLSVPPVLLSGNHEKIARWRREQSLRRTFERRPDLLEAADLDEEEQRRISKWTSEQ
jgi:tRNA (guanine37-N1)-methyltransferase